MSDSGCALLVERCLTPFESSHRIFLFTIKCIYEKTKIRRKEAKNVSLNLKKNYVTVQDVSIGKVFSF